MSNNEDKLNVELCKLVFSDKAYTIFETVNNVGDVMYTVNQDSDNFETYSCYKEELGNMLVHIINTHVY